MLRRLLVAFVVIAVALGTTGLALAQFFTTRQATGQVSSASAPVDVSYICEPQASTINPICPLDDSGGDELIFEANEQMLPGTVRWWKIRIRNISNDPWDILNVGRNWNKVSDPSGQCSVFPVDVTYQYQSLGYQNNPPPRTVLGSGQGPGITILGKPGAANYGPFRDPVQQESYQPQNDNHASVAGSNLFSTLDGGWEFGNNNLGTRSVHIAPGDFEDLLFGIGLPVTTPSQCVNNVWSVAVNFDIQPHQP